MQPHDLALLLRGWRRCVVARNPVVRATDRREARALLLAILLSIVAAPAALSVGLSVHDAQVEAFAAQRLTLHEIATTATSDSSPVNAGYSKYHLTTVHWTVGTEERTEVLKTPYTVKAGELLPIWVDRASHHVPAPLTEQDALTQAVIVGITLWLAVAGVGATSWVVLRVRLERSRSAAWDRAIEDLVP